ncbi:MAG: MFS transporter [Actinomycetota bacterium]
MSRPWIEEWTPDDDVFWQSKGKAIARRNLAFSIFAEFLGFTVWVLWSVSATKLNQAGFNFSDGQLFTLVALPALVGAGVRVPYTLAVGRFGGRNWTVVSAGLLLLPVVLFTLLVTNPGTPYWAFLLGAAAAGLGGGNFASSMANISYFYPDKRKGFALGLNAAGGNLGVAVSQLITPFVIAWGWLAVAGGSQGKSGGLYLQNAAFALVPFIIAAAAGAWLFMDNLKVSQSPIGEQLGVLKRRHTWTIAVLYIGSFGSFIGFSSAFPLLVKTQFPGITASLAFVGPLVGAFSRPAGGWLADRLGGAKVTLWTFAAMLAVTLGVARSLTGGASIHSYGLFLTMFIILFLLTGIGNGSTYRLIPEGFRRFHLTHPSIDQGLSADQRLLQAKRETGAAVGFIGAIGAFGGWLVPQSFGISTSATGGPVAAFYLLAVFYLGCMGLTWWSQLRLAHSHSHEKVPALAEAEA